MSEPFQIYHRTVKLPCDGVASGQPHRSDLDASIIKAARSLVADNKQLQCEVDNDTAGHLSATIKTGAYIVSLHTQFGQNTAYQSGERQTFTSYSIRAESRL